MRLLTISEQTVTVSESPDSLGDRLSRMVSDGTLSRRRPGGKGVMHWKSVGNRGFEASFERWRTYLDVSGQFLASADGRGTTVHTIVAFQVWSVVATAALFAGAIVLEMLPNYQFNVLGLVWFLLPTYTLRSGSTEARRYLDLYLIPELTPPALETRENQDSVSGT